MAMIAPDTVTLWHRSGGAWERSVLAGVRTQASMGDVPSSVGPDRSDELRVYVFADVDVSEGDRVAVGSHADESPVASSKRVATVARRTGPDGRFHHIRAVAR